MTETDRQRACRLAYHRAYYQKNKSAWHSYEANRDKKLVRLRQNTRKYRDSVKESSRRHVAKYKKMYPEKVRARQLLALAIRQGRIKILAACQFCGDNKRGIDGRRLVQAHHFKGYGSPLDVQWLCVGCHSREHSRALKRPEGKK